METKANYTLVGIFAIVVMIASFGFIYWFAELSQSGQFAKVLVRVPGSAAGLNAGSPVRFNGLPVGQVLAVEIDWERPQFVKAMTSIRTDTPLNESSIFKLEAQGLTGASLFEIKTPTGGDNGALQTAYENNSVIEVTAQTSGIANLMETAEEIVGRTDNIMAQVEAVITQANGPLIATVQNAEKITKTVADNADGIDEFLQSVTALSGTIENISQRLDRTLASAERLMDVVDAEKIDNSLGNIEQLTAGAVETMNKVDNVVSQIEPARINGTISNIETATDQARSLMQNANKFVAQFGENSDDIDAIINDIRLTAASLNDASAKFDVLLSEIEPGQISATMYKIAQASDDAQIALAQARKTVEVIGGRATDIDQIIANIGVTTERLTSTTEKVDQLIAEVDPDQIRQTMNNISSASSNANIAMQDARELVATVGARSEDIDQMISDVGQLASRLNTASERVDGVLSKFDSFLGEGDADGLMVQAQETLTSFKDVADSLNSRITPIANNLERFTGSGLQDVEALISEARRSIARIERSIAAIERDPQRLLFGGETVKQFDGRARR